MEILNRYAADLDGKDRRVKRTIWARRKRGGVYDAFMGVRLLPESKERLDMVAKLLNIDASDLLRALIEGIASIPVFSQGIAVSNPPAKSDNIRYV
jgi:hypothetical protein